MEVTMSNRLFALLGGSFAFGCIMMSASAQPSKAQDPDVLSLVKGNSEFAVALYDQLARKDGNLFFSPYSISTALAMTYGGARGKTAQEMKKTLRFHLKSDWLHPAFGKLSTQLDGEKTKRLAQLRVANRLWGQKDYGFLPNFLMLAQTDYHAGLEELDFVNNTEGARQRINAWVEKQTQQKIKDLMPQGSVMRMTRLVLTNAIYFKAAWMHQFSDKDTKPSDFTLADGKKVQVPLMHGNLRAGFVQQEGFSVLVLPYERQELSMIVVLPKDATSLPQVEKQLSEANLAKWLEKSTGHQVDVTLPKFKITARFMLNDTLKEMGMREAFTFGKADFSGMATREELYISAVVHKAFVDVDEKGTEAAAATGVSVGTLSLPPPAVFRADHPFLFLIRDNASGSILFMGRLSNPQS
jgi:serpin B